MIHCRLTPNEKLPDRFLFSGVLKTPSGSHYIGYTIEITKPWFPSSRVAPVIINELKSNLAKISGSPDLLVVFEETLKDVNEALFNLSEQGETEWIGNLNSLIMVISGQEIHLSQSGSLSGYLFRKQKINQITEGLSLERDSHPLKTFSSIVSGSLEENDRLLISNHELFNVISLDMLRQIVVANSPYQACLAIRRVLKKHHIPAVSSMIFNFTNVQEESEPDVVIIEEGFESWYKKVWRASKPKIVDSWNFTKSGAQKAHQTYKEKISPTLKKVAQKSVSLTKTSSATALQYSKEKVVPKVQSQVNKLMSKKPIGDKTADVAEAEEPKQKPDQPKTVEIEKTPESTTKPTPFQATAPEVSGESDQVREDSGELDLKPAPVTLSARPIIKKPIMNLKSASQKVRGFPRKYLYVVIALALALVVAWVVIGKNNDQATKKETTQEEKQSLKEVHDLIVEAETAKAADQTDQALEKLISAKTLLAQAKENDETKDLNSQVAKTIDELSQNTPLKTSELKIEFSDSSIDRLEYISPYFFVSSSKNGKLYRQALGSLETAKEKEIAPPVEIVRGIKDLYLEDSSGSALMMIVTGDGQIFQLDQTSTESKITEMKNPVGKFATADSAGGYFGNLYLLDSSTGLLWKYPLSGAAFGKGVNQVDINSVDLKKAVSLAIDGNIFVLKENGSLVKLLRGVPVEGFNLKNPPKPYDKISKPLKIITSEKINNLYILEAGISNKEPARILEYDKSGNFLRQFSLPDELNNVKDGLINPVDKKAWILSGADVYEFNLP